MTGGLGFSRDSNNRFKDNHKLGQIRAKTTLSKKSSSPDQRKRADPKSLNEAIKHRFEQKNKMKILSLISLIGIILIIGAFLFFF